MYNVGTLGMRMIHILSGMEPSCVGVHHPTQNRVQFKINEVFILEFPI